MQEYVHLTNEPNPKYYRLEGVRHAPACLSQENLFSGKSVLVVRSPGAGDLLMAVPALRAIKKAAPDARIAVLTASSAAPVLLMVPEVDETIVYNTPWELVPSVEPGEGAAELVRALQGRRFDIGIVMTVYGQSALTSALLLFMAGIPRRIAYSPVNPFQLLTDWIPDPEPKHFVRHEVDRQLRLVEMFGADPSDPDMALQIPVGAQEEVATVLAAAGADTRRPLLVCHPHSSDVNRIFPASGYVTALEELAGDGYQIILTGGPGDVEAVEAIAREVGRGAVSTAGRLSFAGLAALVGAADVVVTNNTVPAHLASALRRPVVDVYAVTNPQHIPWHTPHQVLYFSVPEAGRLDAMWNGGVVAPDMPLATPEAIVAAVRSLRRGEEEIR